MWNVIGHIILEHFKLLIDRLLMLSPRVNLLSIMTPLSVALQKQLPNSRVNIHVSLLNRINVALLDNFTSVYYIFPLKPISLPVKFKV